MEHLLLKPLEELDALWIASSARPGDLDKMFLRRFSAKLSTSLPTQAELAEFLATRCDDWNIAVDSPDTFGLLARRSKLVTAKAIYCLAFAAGKSERALSRDMVLKYRFDCD
jgi:SpoVK/Ycf46/Vps4 family AAA+-type ATPase